MKKEPKIPAAIANQSPPKQAVSHSVASLAELYTQLTPSLTYTPYMKARDDSLVTQISFSSLDTSMVSIPSQPFRLGATRPEPYGPDMPHDMIAKYTRHFPMSESDYFDSDYIKDRVDSTERMNWCLANCVGKFRVRQPSVTQTVEIHYWGEDSDDELDPIAFDFDLDDDRILYMIKWKGSTC